jgi:glutathione S-transferase
MLELYHWEPNTYSLKALLALAEKGVSFTSRYFDPTRFEQFAPGFPRNVETDLHLEREGPVLVHDGAVISSSFFILEYVAERFPGADLVPGDAYEHYRARAAGQFLTLQLGPGVCALGCAKYLMPALKARDPRELAAQIERIEPQERRSAWKAVIDGTYDEQTLAVVRERLKGPLQRVEAALAGSAWLAGRAYSIADIDAFAMLRPLPELAPQVVNAHATPRILEFLERVSARPALKVALSFARTGAPEQAFVPGAEPSRWG